MKSGLLIFLAMTGCSAAGANGEKNPLPPTSDGGAVGDEQTGMVNPGTKALAPNTFLVHGAIGLGDVRICFGADGDHAQPSDATVPQTNYPGLAVGGSVFLRNGSQLRGKAVTPFAVSASGLGAAEHGGAMFTCSDLATNPLINRIPIAPITIANKAPSILALVGCAAGVGNPKRCGTSYDASKGNLHFAEVYVDAMLVADGLGALALNLSPSLEADVGGKTAYGRLGPLADPCKGIDIGHGSLGVGDISPAAVTVQPPALLDAEGFAVCVQNQVLLARSYVELQSATDPRSLPGDHFSRTADFVFTIVGDTTATSGPEALHALAIPFEATK